MLKRWRDDIVLPDKDIHFYVGNQNRYRRTFSVLGTWYPKVEDVLFSALLERVSRALATAICRTLRASEGSHHGA